jgi:hypothetical protein
MAMAPRQVSLLVKTIALKIGWSTARNGRSAPRFTLLAGTQNLHLSLKRPRHCDPGENGRHHVCYEMLQNWLCQSQKRTIDLKKRKPITARNR